MPDRDNTTFIGVRSTLFGYAACLYDTDAGALQYGAIDYQTEREALAEAEGWSDAECVPLDAHALRLSRHGWTKKDALSPLAIDVLADGDDIGVDGDRNEPVVDSRRRLSMR